MLFIPQLTPIGKTIEFWLDRFVVKDINNDFDIVVEGILNCKDTLYKFCGLTQNDIGLTTLIVMIIDGSSIWHETPSHLIFRGMKLMVRVVKFDDHLKEIK